MVAIKTHQADNFIKDPQENQIAYLVYGSDDGRVAETALQLAKNWSKKFGDGGEIVTIDERSLADNPDIISIEVRSVPMFGGRTTVRLRAGNKVKPSQIEELLTLTSQNLLIIEAGNLTPSSPMRKLFEKASNAAAIACFPDDTRDIARLIDDELTAKGISITPAGRKLLTSSLGTDRGISRMELQKLALYAFDRPHIDVDDIVACVGDSSLLAYDSLITLVLSGDGATALDKLDRLLASGQSCTGFITVLGKHLQRLYRIRAQMETGRSAENAVSSLRPPVHFKQKDAMIAQASHLDLTALNKALHMVQEATTANRRNTDLELVRTERLIMLLSRIGAVRQR